MSLSILVSFFVSDAPFDDIMKGTGGCWSCIVRRKKCDGAYPVCNTCASLHITCHHGEERPIWMDGGPRQEEMAQKLKIEVKQNANRRRTDACGSRMSAVEGRCNDPALTFTTCRSTAKDNERGHSCRHCLFEYGEGAGAACPIESQTAHYVWSRHPVQGRGTIVTTFPKTGDNNLLMFYFDNVIPFLYPFYQPDPLREGGKAWILELVTISASLRQIALCQSSHFFNLLRGTTNPDLSDQAILEQAGDAFGMLKHVLNILNTTSITEHLHGAVRILTGITQIQRFEIAALNFENCQSHLDAAIALFEELLETCGPYYPSSDTSFMAVLRALQPDSQPPSLIGLPSVEQAALRFTSALLILDDVIASTIRHKSPRLYRHHKDFLGDGNGSDSVINLEAVLGCQNWVLRLIGEVSALDAWKHEALQSGHLDSMEFVHWGETIKTSLEAHLARLTSELVEPPSERLRLPDAFDSSHGQGKRQRATQVSAITYIWAHAALIYLFVVVSGWQFDQPEVQYHVSQVLEVLAYDLSPRELLRAAVWPFCVAGCLAQPGQEDSFRRLANSLEPLSVFGTIGKALEIMEGVWRERGEDSSSRDLASCFRRHGSLVLLV